MKYYYITINYQMDSIDDEFDIGTPIFTETDLEGFGSVLDWAKFVLYDWAEDYLDNEYDSLEYRYKSGKMPSFSDYLRGIFNDTINDMLLTINVYEYDSLTALNADKYQSLEEPSYKYREWLSTIAEYFYNRDYANNPEA